MRILTWQWGRRGAGPRFGLGLHQGLAALPDTTALLSLSAQAELMAGPDAPVCDLPIDTYDGTWSLARRLLGAPFAVAPLRARLRELRLDAAVCAMSALLDPLMTRALAGLAIPYVVVVHDAVPHLGDRLSAPVVGPLQRRLLRGAAGVVALTSHVAELLAADGIVVRGIAAHPPFHFGPTPPPFAHSGRPRLLFFGRLLPYKGLDLLAAALGEPGLDCEVRIVGSGPESASLAALRALPFVQLENRWVPEGEIGALLAWADALVLPYLEASQSGVAPAALAAGRFVIATDVGGLGEQLASSPLARLCPPTADALALAIRSLPDSAPAAGGRDDGGWLELARTVREAVLF
jgi:glycosyltransferase involved in cell wall biosynthesis